MVMFMFVLAARAVTAFSDFRVAARLKGLIRGCF